MSAARRQAGGIVRRLLAVVVLIAVAAFAWLWHTENRGTAGPGIATLAKPQAAADPDALSRKLIPDEDLPPDGTRSLFDHLIAQNQQLPYPFEKLVALVQKLSPDGAAPVMLLIPQGRSLLKAQADYEHPRAVLAADFQAADTPTALGLSTRGQLFLGFVENAHEVEVISYNEAAGRYEFQLVQNYCDGCAPKLVYARRVICQACHQGSAPIFPQRPWNETNGEPETAEKIRAARGNDAPYLGVPLSVPLGNPERFEQLVDVGDFVPPTQRAWIDGCGDGEAGIACRRQMLKMALAYLWNPGEFDEHGADAAQLRQLQAAHWPKSGIAVADGDLRNRDPIGEGRGIAGWFRGLLSRPPKPGEGAKNNEDLAAFDKLPRLRAELDPLTPRPPRRVLTAADIDGAYGLAALITDADFKTLESAGAFKLDALLAAADRADAAHFAPAPYSRVKTMNALLAALGHTPAPDYCCLSTAELSPPLASGVPPLRIEQHAELRNFEHYCFACHRGNPSQRLNFMAGDSEDAVLALIKAKAEIRDVLDWTRYAGTDKANKLMPPADSRQRAALEAAVKQDPKLLDSMRDTVPSLFNF